MTSTIADCEQSLKMQFGKSMYFRVEIPDSIHFCILLLVVSNFHKLRQYHIARLHTLQWQGDSLRKKLCKTKCFKVNNPYSKTVGVHMLLKSVR